MNFVVLGSGTANPHPRRSSPGFWLETSGGVALLDFGASTLHRLAEEELDWANIDSIWISHFHLDHCAGLAPFLFATRHAPETRDRSNALKIFGAVGLRDLISQFDKAGGGKLLKQRFPVEMIEIDHLNNFELLPGVSAIAMKTPHTDNSYAIRIDDGQATMVYTSDTGFNKGIASFAKNADLLILESSFLRDKTTAIHLELAEAMYLIRHARPKKAMLTHFYADWDRVDFNVEIGSFDPSCEVIEAVDGRRLTISDLSAK
jgi:ribonuclease BN (tRNA processing enzyme)